MPSLHTVWCSQQCASAVFYACMLSSDPASFASIPIKEQCVSVGLSVFFLSATRDFLLCGAASEYESRSRRGRPRASGQSCTARARARMPYKNRSTELMPFKKQNRTRAHAVVYVSGEIFKKREKEDQHATSQVQFTVRLLLECLLFE